VCRGQYLFNILPLSGLISSPTDRQVKTQLTAQVTGDYTETTGKVKGDTIWPELEKKTEVVIAGRAATKKHGW